MDTQFLKISSLLLEWDPFEQANPQPIFTQISQSSSWELFAVLRETGPNTAHFSTKWGLIHAGTTELAFSPSDRTQVLMLAGTQKARSIVADTRFTVDIPYSELGTWEPVIENAGIMLFPLILGQIRLLILAIKLRHSKPDFESHVLNEHRERFEEICQTFGPSLISAAALYEADRTVWRACLRDLATAKSQVFDGYLLRLLQRWMQSLQERSSDLLELVGDVLNYFSLQSMPSAAEERIYHERNWIGLKDIFCDYIANVVEHEVHQNDREIVVCSRLMLAYFLHRVCEDVIRAGCLGNLCRAERQEFYYYFANALRFWTTQYVDADQQSPFRLQESSNADLMQEMTGFFAAIAYLVSEYVSLAGDVHRDLRPDDRLREMAYEQAVFYATKKNYRDHFLHAMEVFFLGLFLTKVLLKRDPAFEAAAFLNNWYVASLFHDIGYPLELYDILFHETKYLSSREVRDLRKHIASETEKAVTNYNMGVIQRFTDTGVPLPKFPQRILNHGIVSAAEVLEALEQVPYLSRAETLSFIADHRDGLYAIAAHDFATEALRFDEAPVAVLLRICDEIQDWDRPRVDVLPFREQLLAAVRYRTSFTPAGARLMNQALVSVREASPSNPSGNPFTLCLTLDYRDVDDQGFFVIYQWLLKSHKFQGIVLKNTMDIEITFLSKPRAEEGDMNRFKVARRKHRIWHFEEWMDLVDASDPDDNGDERLTVSVSKLNTAYPIRVNPSTYLKTLIQEW